ncbi:MAG: type I methionyl aminopeptidase [Candidatus Ryanbacteria bacterium RIFCSPHIGHO2_02_FULL_45_17b]|uniref:Methionine aminopeptidase n=1 Tax=Candidatus Ryanbacteria bacterium RIFCSPHIGHO2_01_FULL_45_22 TaxID=1802114 RepID=A0A1G2G1F8_9BACT|nr:MAG: type I methionyl aminopeptidase [Candidatus Ryanbacteria bacterium RIFCSPHIGHO2_01_FULL_45_22]OGZ46463.1 MAG: type I methionyl aminopeptidase [Candidatus Ryanbacteria bacterium RIFCSPHIGHO2_02_FULL_45_17b]
MSLIKSQKEIQALLEGGKKLADVLQSVVELVRPGVTTKELDELAEKLITACGGTPSFKGYSAFGARNAYPASLCTSINDEVVHGIPSEKRVLKEGDIIGLDIGMKYQGLFTDMAVTVGVGRIDADSQKLIDVTHESLEKGIAEVHPGARIGDIGEAVQVFVESNGFGVVRELVGHGVGHAVHEEPEVPNFGKKGQGLKLEEGMVLALEPMVTARSPRVLLAKDEWTWKTKDGSRAAHFEHTVVVTKDGVRVLTIV